MHPTSAMPLLLGLLAVVGCGQDEPAPATVIGPSEAETPTEPADDEDDAPPEGAEPIWAEAGESEPIDEDPTSTGDCAGPDNGPYEICNDHIDNNCDGSAAPCDNLGWWRVDAVGDPLIGPSPAARAGLEVQAIGDIDGDGHRDVAIGAPAQDGTVAQQGVLYLERGPLPAPRILGDRSIEIWGPEVENAEFGKTVVSEVDYDGDGHPDLIAGCSTCVDTGTHHGIVYMLQGPITSGGRIDELEDNHILGQQDTRFLGRSVIVPGDLDGDGFVDMVVGANGTVADDTLMSGAGAMYLFEGPLLGDKTPDDAALTFKGTTQKEWVGTFNVLLGDTDGDGIDELATSAYNYGTDKQGAVFIIPVTERGTVYSSDWEQKIVGTQRWLGRGLDAPGDLDGDGLADIAVGAPRANLGAGENSGAVYLLNGPFERVTKDTEADVTIAGGFAYQWFGEQIRSTHDLDGDGLNDLVVGSRPGWEGEEKHPGQVFVFDMPGSGALDPTHARTVYEGAMLNEATGSILEIDDLDHDGYDDVILGKDAGFTGTGGGAWIIPGLGY